MKEVCQDAEALCLQQKNAAAPGQQMQDACDLYNTSVTMRQFACEMVDLITATNNQLLQQALLVKGLAIRVDEMAEEYKNSL